MPDRSRPLRPTATADDIRQFRETVAAALKTSGSDSPPTPDPEWRRSWPALADLGVTSFCVATEHGGSGLEVEVAVATAMELGVALHGSPYAGTVAGAHALSSRDPDERSASDLLASLVTGERTCAFGVLDPHGRVARNVDGAPEADALLLVEPGSGELELLTDPATWTVAPLPHRFDLSRTAGDVTIGAAAGLRIGRCRPAHDLFRLLLAADALGATRSALDRTVAYAREREAFGRAIGGFQAVQHRLADHAVRVRGMTLAVREAARALAHGSPGTERAVRVAEASVSSAAGHVLHDLLQLTGAIGFTWEYGLHLQQRRVHQDARLAANPGGALRALSLLEGWCDGA